MIQGTMSSVGKSLLVTALCRVFARQGVKVAPFKAQNMSNNAAVCADGSEIGRAQFTQAGAAKVEPSVYMNPVLLKPEADSRSQVILMGRPWHTLPARSYYERKRELWKHVTAALDHLREEYELVIIEGAGSPVELNLKRGDIVNMAIAQYANAPVLLAGDIDRGGIFAQLLGTLDLFDDAERALVRGLIVNQFRGDLSLFDDGISILEGRGNVPVLGVVPYMHNHAIPEEDAVAIEGQQSYFSSDGLIDIAVIRLPRIANFDDFAPLAAEAGVNLRYVADVESLGQPDAIILPGTKSTIADLLWLRERGLADAIRKLADSVAVAGICGGYQMLGEMIGDPERVESDLLKIDGLGLLPHSTDFIREKATYQIGATITGGAGWLDALAGAAISGYEIHSGRTEGMQPWLQIHERNRARVEVSDGGLSADGRIWGCYVHGLFANENLRHAWLHSLGWQGESGGQIDLNSAFDRLADHVEAALDMSLLNSIVEQSIKQV
jgi:adenosylcobyric acid synthase